MHVLASVFIQAEFCSKGDQVIKTESAVWMSVRPFVPILPHTSSFVSSKNFTSCEFVLLRAHWRDTRLSPFAKTLCLAFLLIIITVQYELNLNRIPVDKEAGKYCLWKRDSRMLYRKTLGKNTPGDTDEASVKLLSIALLLRWWGPVYLCTRETAVFREAQACAIQVAFTPCP